MNEQAADYKLPPTLVSRVDLARLIREVETIDGDLEAQKVRSQGKAEYHLPPTSRGLRDFLELNKLDLADDKMRVALKEWLHVLKDKAPIIHMTFAVDVDTEVLQKLTAWVRDNAHPQGLITVGLQPSLVGGVYIRTPNHVHDFSMRSLLQNKRDVLVKALEETN